MIFVSHYGIYRTGKIKNKKSIDADLFLNNQYRVVPQKKKNLKGFFAAE